MNNLQLKQKVFLPKSSKPAKLLILNLCICKYIDFFFEFNLEIIYECIYYRINNSELDSSNVELDFLNYKI